MAIILNDNIRANIAKPLEDKRMNNGVPYTSISQANSLLNQVVDRYESLEVVIGTPSDWAIYWYKDGVADTDLVLKPDGDVTADGNNTFTGQNAFKNLTIDAVSSGFASYLDIKSEEGSNVKFEAGSNDEDIVVTLPNMGGILALTSDIPTVNEYFRGKFVSKAALDANVFSPALKAGDYAQVDAGGGSDVVNYNWDADDSVWVEGGSGSGATDTDGLPEGTTNLYFTEARVLATDLGTVTPTNSTITTGDSLQTLANKAQGQINAKQNTLTAVNVGNFMDNGLATKLTPVGADALLARDSVTNEAVEINLNSIQSVLSIASSSELNTGTDNVKITTAQALEGSKYLDGAFAKISATTTGTSTAYVASLTPALASYVTNQPILLTFNVASGASPTVNVNSLGARSLVRMDGTAIAANDLVTGSKYLFIYDGTAFRMATPIINEVIRNQTASQTASYYITGTARIDTGLGLGLAPNAGAFETIAAGTASKGQLLLTQGTTDYTGTLPGMTSFVNGVLKIYDGTGLTSIIKKDRNPSLSSVNSLNVIVSSADGSVSVGGQVMNRDVTDTDVISAITGATYNRTNVFTASITPASSKIFYQGQRYKSSTYLYVATSNNVSYRIPLYATETGWAIYTDNVYNSGSPLVINQGVMTKIPCNASTVINNNLPIGVTSWWDSTNNKFTPSVNGDSYLVNLRFTAINSSTTGLADVNCDVSGLGTVDGSTISLRKGVGNSQRISLKFDLYTAATFLTNGGEFFLNSIDGNTSIYDISYKITRLHRSIQ